MKFQIYQVVRPRDAKDQETDWREKFQGTIRQPKLTPSCFSLAGKHRKEALAPGLTVFTNIINISSLSPRSIQRVK